MAHTEDFVLHNSFFRVMRTLNILGFSSHYLSAFVFQRPSDFSSCMNVRHKGTPGLPIFTQSICELMLRKSSKQSTKHNSGMAPSTYISRFILSPQPWKSKKILVDFIGKEIEAYRIYFLPQLLGASHKADM